MARKVFVDVVTKHDVNGIITPLLIYWEDGHKYKVDKILDVSPRASLKVGGQGVRYTCRISGKETFLFLDDFEKRWFVEAKQ